jgi:5-methyltetrahydropteroyltriglutamate--homocysteine methyltransferase
LAEGTSKRFSLDGASDCDSGLSEELMAHGINRFLTTHTGSLPRPDDLIRAMFAKEEGVPVDRTGLAAKIRAAVAGVVKKQVDSGVDLVNDGEMQSECCLRSRGIGFYGT